jgi:hypothetical protein
MEWLDLAGWFILLVAAGTAAFYMHSFTVQTRKCFRDRQPDLRVTNLSAMTSGEVLTLSPELENVGGGVAYDCLLQMGGWEGSFAVKHINPRGARAQKHAISIVLGPDAPIRVKPLSNGYLRLSYRDEWGLTYECWYPVSQQGSGSSSRYTVHVDLEHPDVTEPRPSLGEMWKLLRTRSTRG